jgi:hypothetical protein
MTYYIVFEIFLKCKYTGITLSMGKCIYLTAKTSNPVNYFSLKTGFIIALTAFLQLFRLFFVFAGFLWKE